MVRYLIKNLRTSFPVLVIFLCLFFVLGVKNVSADALCGGGWHCTGTGSYLRVGSCQWTGSYCANVGTSHTNYSCASGTCSAYVDNVEGCNANPSGSTNTSGFCSAGGGSCNNCGGSCGAAAPYDGTCTCTGNGSGGSSGCGVPVSGVRGCCAPGDVAVCGNGICEAGETNACIDCYGVGYCGNDVINAGETCANCPADVGACPAICGNHVIETGETCATCPLDVGVCQNACGNGYPDAGETCSNCPADMGACGGSNSGSSGSYTPGCPNGYADPGETCSSCPADVGACQSTCGNGYADAGETCANCPQDLGACQPPTFECVPNCTAGLCGQADGCGGLCSDLDDRAAPPPTLVSPVDEALVAPFDELWGIYGTQAVNLTIRTQANPSYDADYVFLQIYPEGTSCAHVLAACGNLAINTDHDQEITYTFHVRNDYYGQHARFQWRAWHQNATCSQRVGVSSTWHTFVLGEQVSGRVLKDDGIAGLSGGVCTSPLSPVPYVPQGDEAITITHTGVQYSTPLNSDGTWSMLAPVSNTGLNTVNLSKGGTAVTCGCPAGCQYSGINSPSSGLVFYYQAIDVRDNWWQTIGGSVYAGRTTGTAIESLVPVDTCTGPACQPYMSLRNDAGDADSSGVAFTGGGQIDTSNATGYQSGNIDQDGRNIQSVNASTDTLVENYSYFYRLYSMGINPVSDLTASPTKPSVAPANARAYYRNGSMTIDNAWTLSNTDSMVVFVNGDLTINQNITVPTGGFLAFIVSGNITVGSGVCQSDPASTVASVQGVFVANGSFTVQNTGSGDCKFVGEGIFTAWNGMSLKRDFRNGGAGDALNAQNPSVLLRYRPDFVVNIPARMTRPLYQWQEVAP
ncbi:MAG: hypothetical protein ABI425_04695 [Patescibacteria group bacterium]